MEAKIELWHKNKKERKRGDQSGEKKEEPLEI